MMKRAKKAARKSKPIPPRLLKVDISLDPKSLRTGAEIHHVAQDAEDLKARKTTVRGRLISEGKSLHPRGQCTDAAMKYLADLTGIGGGDDPVGFLITSHRELVRQRSLLRAKYPAIFNEIACDWGEAYSEATPGAESEPRTGSY